MFLILLELEKQPWLAAYLLGTVLFSYYATLGLSTILETLYSGKPLGVIEWRVPFFLPMSKFCAEDDPAQAILSAKVRGMPINPFPEKLVCANDTSHLPMLFVYCTDNPLGMFESSRARAIERPRTQVVDLDARHALMLTRTDEVARLCSEFAER